MRIFSKKHRNNLSKAMTGNKNGKGHIGVNTFNSHKSNCQCSFCKMKRKEPHKMNCKCVVCLSKKGKYRHSKETRLKISKAFKGEKHPLWKECNLICPVCKTKFHVKFSHKKKRIYCSKKCWNEGIVGKYKGKNSPSWGRKVKESTKAILRTYIGKKASNWRGGTSKLPYPFLFNQQLKDKVRVRDNFICQICGIPELECYEKLHCHHIDYNKNNISLKNLISLCRSCHAKTSTGSKNYWMKYFKEEKYETNCIA